MTFRKAPAQGDSPFNMAMIYYLRLNDLLAEKDRAAIGNDIRHYFQCIVAVFNNVYFQVRKEEEIPSIKQSIDKVEKLLTGGLPPDKNLAQQYDNMRTWEARKLLMQIDRELMVVMDKRKMIFPRIETTFGLDKIRKNYGLDDA